MPAPDGNTLHALLRNYIDYLKEEGVTGVPRGTLAAKTSRKKASRAAQPASSKAAQTAPKTAERSSRDAAPRPDRPTFRPEPPAPAYEPMPAAKTASTPTMEPSPAFTPGPAPRAANTPDDTLETIAAEVRACRACVLCQRRLNAVPGEGNANHPDLMFVGEGPGANEDAQGRPFVGRSGELLDKMIMAMGYSREQVFIGNIVKCRPPGNRTPTLQEMAFCMPYLLRQIALIQPRIIVCLGATAMTGLLGPVGRITQVRGNWYRFNHIPTMVTFHPAALLRDPSKKRDTWHDLQLVMAALKNPTPSGGTGPG